MRRKRKRRFAETDEDIELSMTPMIDVVFQLLIYFLVTFSTADVLAHLDVSRPQADAAQSSPPPAGDMIRVAVRPAGYTLNGRAVSVEELGSVLRRLAAVSTNQMVLVSCAEQSLHGELIQALDLCAGAGLNQISVMSGK